VRDEIDALMNAGARVTDADVRALDLHSAEADLMEEIMSTPVFESVGAAPPERKRRSGRRLTALAAAAAVAVVVLFVANSSNDAGSVWAAEVVEVAEAVPRLLIDDANWRIQYADEYTTEDVTVTFTDGTREFELRWWQSADPYEAPDEADTVEAITVLGHEALLVRHEPVGGATAQDDLHPLYAGTAFTTVWADSGYRVIANGWGFDSQEDYQSVLGALREVDVDTWLTAMPASVVRPDDTDAVVAEMMVGMPTPAGFDAAEIVTEVGVRDREGLIYEVSSAVTCAWLDQWVDANRVGDQAAADEAVGALGTARDWPIVQEWAVMRNWEPFPWQYADAIASGGTLADGTSVDDVLPAGSVEGDRVLEEDVMVYELVLGCHARQ
jgi:hypothetical protein